MSEPLRLVALDDEDLAVMSAHLQDAVIKVKDMVFLPKSKRFAVLAARFDWLGTDKGRQQRCYTGLHFERVLKAAVSGFDQAAVETCLNLLSIHFTADDAPAGHVILTFSGGAAVQARCRMPGSPNARPFRAMARQGEARPQRRCAARRREMIRATGMHEVCFPVNATAELA